MAEGPLSKPKFSSRCNSVEDLAAGILSRRQVDTWVPAAIRSQLSTARDKHRRYRSLMQTRLSLVVVQSSSATSNTCVRAVQMSHTTPDLMSR
jgi:hypothetical protein|eukprot:SAG25_NODE_88_length_16343_cov_89.495383_12_plen_93_part_00